MRGKEKPWVDLVNLKGTCKDEPTCKSNLVWRNDGAQFHGVQDDLLKFDFAINECAIFGSKLESTECTSKTRSLCQFMCPSELFSGKSHILFVFVNQKNVPLNPSPFAIQDHVQTNVTVHGLRKSFFVSTTNSGSLRI